MAFCKVDLAARSQHILEKLQRVKSRRMRRIPAEDRGRAGTMVEKCEVVEVRRAKWCRGMLMDRVGGSGACEVVDGGVVGVVVEAC